jgi:hypothetical protein
MGRRHTVGIEPFSDGPQRPALGTLGEDPLGQLLGDDARATQLDALGLLDRQNRLGPSGGPAPTPGDDCPRSRGRRPAVDRSQLVFRRFFVCRLMVGRSGVLRFVGRL